MTRGSEMKEVRVAEVGELKLTVCSQVSGGDSKDTINER
jgi:hypothetical protein